MRVIKEGNRKYPWNGEKTRCKECGADLCIGIEDLVLNGSLYHIYCPFCDTIIASFKKEALPTDRIKEIRRNAKKNRYARATSSKEKMWIWAEFTEEEHAFLFMMLALFCLISPIGIMLYISFPVGFIIEVLSILIWIIICLN